MALAIENFLHSLALYIVSRAAAFTPAVPIVYAGTPRELFLYEASEAQVNGVSTAANVYTVIVPSGGGSSVKHPKPTITVQFMTRALGPTANSVAMERACTIFDTLTADDNSAAVMVTIPGKTIAGADDGTWLIVNADWVQRPSMLGRDSRGRTNVSFNFDFGIYKSS